MDRSGPLKVLVELESAGSPRISGRFALDGDVTEFSGWLSLMALLERARADTGGSRDPPPPGADPLDAPVPAEPAARRAPQPDPQYDQNPSDQEG